VCCGAMWMVWMTLASDVIHDNVSVGDISVCCAQYNGSAGKNSIYCSKVCERY